jgi:hypothetical protein
MHQPRQQLDLLAPVQCCATSASHRSKNSRTASWLPWSSLTGTPVGHTWTYKLDKAA